MTFQTLDMLDAHGKTVLLRADLNIPVTDGQITDTTRLQRIIPTIRALQKQNARIVILAHFGRPKGKKTAKDSLKPIATELGALLNEEVHFVPDCIGDAVHMHLSTMTPRDVAVLENLRFYEEEEKNDPAFARELAELGDAYVNDAFSASHRAHASIEAIAHILPAYAGLLMQEELNALQNGLENPAHPVMAVVAGSKISTKLSVLHNLVKKVDHLFIGGGMANVFLVAKGIEVGKSLCEFDMKDEAAKIMAEADKAGCNIILPVDRVAVKEFGKNVPFDIVATENLTADQEAVDIGPDTVKKLRDILQNCKTVLWNGPVGVFEVEPFNKGTNDLAKIVAELTTSGQLISVAGGGETVSALEQAGVTDQFTYISTAGGAFLEWLEGKALPGIQALMNAHKMFD